MSPSVITWLRCFEAAARLGSFTLAAEELHLTQSAVSQQIRHLERQVSGKLFYRSARRVELTESGRFLQGQISPALQQISQALSMLNRPTGPFNVSCSPSFAMRWLMPRLSDFLRKHPSIDVRIETGFHRLNRARFLAERLHFAIRLDPFTYSDLESEQLFDEYIVPVATRKYVSTFPLLRKKRDLRGTTLLHDSAAWDGAAERVEWDTCLHILNLVIDNRHKHLNFNLCALANAAALAGEGIAASETAVVLDELSHGRLVPVFRQKVPIPARPVLLYIDRTDERIGTFAAWLREECGRFVEQRELIFRRLKVQ